MLPQVAVIVNRNVFQRNSDLQHMNHYMVWLFDCQGLLAVSGRVGFICTHWVILMTT